MGKKDATSNVNTGTHVPPVEQYRKHIGKQDYKKSKKDTKAQKRHADQKQSVLGIQEVILIVGAMFGLVAGVYLLMYWYLGTWESAAVDETPN
ncbi:triple QxxK/R motif-containing protein-like [Gigantopelta aegis]|uniref:triple QxxK/R motif-containing protein-like n=1 Tax=Gigantopelta aegis TaxID=1735272 RepID=UPI001B88CCEE|nr:triple QxxK/R motif-containing protein-like [Gigantopelta aegis]XP_041376295.1 triple QxxK/R motif-containing protein-like [Gigantopelta aegis]